MLFDQEDIISGLVKFKDSVTLVDLSLEDQPLIYVNDEFCELTGYSREEVLGRNCRFLQGEKTNKRDVKKISKAINEEKAIFCDLLNYKKCGTEFFNRLVLLPIQSKSKVFFLGLQTNSDHLIKSFEQGFDANKKSKDIRDIINTSLMKFYIYLSKDFKGDKEDRSSKVSTVLNEISKTVVSI